MLETLALRAAATAKRREQVVLRIQQLALELRQMLDQMAVVLLDRRLTRPADRALFGLQGERDAAAPAPPPLLDAHGEFIRQAQTANLI